MNLTDFTGNTNVIAGLADEPALTSAQLKAKFDEVGTAIKTFINQTHNPEIEQMVAEEKASLQTAISNLNTTLTGNINTLNETENAMISDNYSNMKAYKVGDLCIYNNVLYKCISAITVGEAWNSSHWEQTTIGDVFDLCRGKTLYENQTGSQKPTLSETSENFEYIDIEYKYGSRYSSVRVYNPNGKNISLMMTGEGGSSIWIGGAWLLISGTSIQTKNGSCISFWSNGSMGGYANASQLYITKVIGYKR